MDSKRSWALLVGAGCVGLAAILGGVAYGGVFGEQFKTPGLVVLLVLALPSIGYVFVSLISLGAAAPYRPLVPRESLLWSWLNFMGRGSAGVLILVSGSLIGGLLGAQISNPNGDLVALVGFAAALVFVWFMVVVVLWTIRAGIDIARLGDQRNELLRKWLHKRGSRDEGRSAKILSFGTELTAVVLAGFAMLYLLAIAYLALGQVVGFFSIA
ncbi:hypothetical protein I6E74_03490 [Salinibacterium sp. SWN139]|uniref:hypothetical protein n=1 Tax=Salinibacterium sp. SWN139 TaxID=2792055 RepID=UPI0018CF6A60|nr:hypothetical protein [Salinibacterium sp. SWN139]MBH0053230.1 hypothetical protein [Salinibacterium sp. SWN139]